MSAGKKALQCLICFPLMIATGLLGVILIGATFLGAWWVMFP